MIHNLASPHGPMPTSSSVPLFLTSCLPWNGTGRLLTQPRSHYAMPSSEHCPLLMPVLPSTINCKHNINIIVIIQLPHEHSYYLHSSSLTCYPCEWPAAPASSLCHTGDPCSAPMPPGPTFSLPLAPKKLTRPLSVHPPHPCISSINDIHLLTGYTNYNPSGMALSKTFYSKDLSLSTLGNEIST